MKKLALLALALLTVGACTATEAAEPAPTPLVIVKTIEVPGPQPTPQIITKTIKVPTPITPKACLDALNDSDALLGNLSNWISAMADGKYKRASTLSDEVGPLIDAYFSTRDQCRYLADPGT